MNIEKNPYIFLKTLKKCKNVLSSALHGLITAVSLEMPNLRIIVSNEILGGYYKFIEYYLAYGLNLQKNLIYGKIFLIIINKIKILEKNTF